MKANMGSGIVLGVRTASPSSGSAFSGNPNPRESSTKIHSVVAATAVFLCLKLLCRPKHWGFGNKLIKRGQASFASLCEHFSGDSRRDRCHMSYNLTSLEGLA